jgi:hypothetical protein
MLESHLPWEDSVLNELAHAEHGHDASQTADQKSPATPGSGIHSPRIPD